MLRIYASITTVLFVTLMLVIIVAGVVGKQLLADVLIYSEATGALPDMRLTALYLSDVNRRINVLWRESESFASIEIFPSADGRLAVEGCTFTGACDLYLWEDGEETRLTNSPERRERHIRWSADGRLVFWSCDGYIECDFWLWNDGVAQILAHSNGEVGAELMNLTPGAWGSDGRLAISYCKPVVICELLIWDGETLQNLTNTPDRSEIEQAWSNDGRLAFSSCDTEHQHCDMLVWDGSGFEFVTQDVRHGQDANATWSADNVLAFTRCDLESTCDVLLWDGSELENITPTSTISELFPTWIHDGQLTYTSNCYALVVWDQGNISTPPLERPCAIGSGLWSMSQLLIYTECDNSSNLCDLMLWDGQQALPLTDSPLSSERPLAWLP